MRAVAAVRRTSSPKLDNRRNANFPFTQNENSKAAKIEAILDDDSDDEISNIRPNLTINGLFYVTRFY